MQSLRTFFVLLFLGSIWVLCGCSLFDLQDEAVSALNVPPGNGAASVAFNIIIPGRAVISPTVRASETPAEVTFRITLLQPDNSVNQTISFVKTAVVQSDGSAATTFSALPEGAALGEISIEGGNIGGKSFFHGASDLFPGDNVMTVSPPGSLHESDILANAVQAIAADPELLKTAKPNLVTNIANAAAAFIANPTAHVYADVLEVAAQNQLTFDSSRFSQISISAADGSLQATGQTTWSMTPDRVWKDTANAGTGLMPVTVVRHGLGDYAIIAWENISKSTWAFSRQSSSTGALLNYLSGSGSNGFIPQGSQVLPGDGSLVLAGKYSGNPTLIRWNGNANSDLSSGVSATGIVWNRVFEIASTNTASASISYLEYDKTGTGKIFCQVKDPALGNRLFYVDPSTGAPVEKQQTNNFGIWSQAGSGSVALGWDGMDAANSYRVFYATGTVIATESAPFVACKEKVLLFENLVNGQVYTFQVGAIDADNRYLSWSSTVKATPLGASEPIVYSNWKLNANVYEIGSANWPANVRIMSFDGSSRLLVLEITGTSPFKVGSIIIGVFNSMPVSVKLPMLALTPTPPGVAIPQTIPVVVEGASMQEVFSECKYLFRGRMSQLPAMSEKLLQTSDPAYQLKMNYLRGGLRHSIRASLTRPIAADPTYGDLSLEMENFEFDPDVVVSYETFLGTMQQFEMRVDGYAACDIYAKFVASRAVELPVIEGTLLPHTEIPFFVGPVPGTWGREITASWKFILKAEAEVKAGSKMRIDFRSGVNWSAENAWGGQLLWKVKNTPMFEAKLQGTFASEAAIEMKNSLKVGGLAGPELNIKPYIKTEATLSTEKPCQVDAALSVGLQGELKAIVQAWSYDIAEWKKEFEPFGPWVIASNTVSANATPTLTIAGPKTLTNELKLSWPSYPSESYFPHICSSTGTDSFILFMDDSKGLNKGLSRIEVAVDDQPAFLSFTLASETTGLGYTFSPYPLLATLTMKLPLVMNDNMETFSLEEVPKDFVKWYTPFRLSPGKHEFSFRVYDKCGDFSIATHAVEVAEDNNVFKGELAQGTASISYEIGLSGYQSGEYPARQRKIAPTAEAFDIYPYKAGKANFKYWANNAYEWAREGNFSVDTRSGIWILKDANGNQARKVEFDNSGNAVNYAIYSTDADGNLNTKFEIRPTANGNVNIGLVTTDTSQLWQDLAYDKVVTGVRTNGIVSSGNSYDIETFVGGKRNGLATHTYCSESGGTITIDTGTYADDRKDGQWFRKVYKNTHELDSTLENNFAGGVLDGQVSYSDAGGLSYAGAYSQGVPSGSWTVNNSGVVTSFSYVNGEIVGDTSAAVYIKTNLSPAAFTPDANPE